MDLVGVLQLFSGMYSNWQNRHRKSPVPDVDSEALDLGVEFLASVYACSKTSLSSREVWNRRPSWARSGASRRHGAVGVTLLTTRASYLSFLCDSGLSLPMNSYRRALMLRTASFPPRSSCRRLVDAGTARNTLQ